jgi:hypothetical protein
MATREGHIEHDGTPRNNGDMSREHDADASRDELSEDNTAPMFGLEPKQEQAIVALLNQPTVAQAAQVSGVSERTLHRWLGEPTFAQAYRTARREAFSHAVSMAQRYTPLAVQTLAKTMTDTSSPHSSRVSAASNLLKFGRESIELDELVGRVEALELKNTEREQLDEWKRR